MTTAEASVSKLALQLPETGLWIDGEWREAEGGKTFTVINPTTEETLAEVAAAQESDIDAAVAAARRQLDGGAWSTLPAGERGRILYRLADLVERDFDLLCVLEAVDVGKPIAEARLSMLPQTIACFRYFAGWADKIEGRVIPTAGHMGQSTHNYTIREPVGVVGAIIPWNAPTMLVAWKLAPALAAGCTVVLKPSEDAPLTALHLAGLLEEAGLPAGVVNIVPGYGEPAGSALVKHPGVDKISFTGSPEVGRLIARTAADSYKRVSLELGGKSPQIIFDDADVDAAIFGTKLGLFANQGEVCAAGTRVLVQRGVHDDIVAGLVEAANAVQLGEPLDPDTTMGALINSTQLDRVMGYIQSGVDEGATVAAGGSRPDGRGYFVRPTIFTGANNDMKIAREEIFGPVGTVISFDDPEEALAIANDTPYGLSASIWTRDVGKAHRMAARVRAGSVCVNTWGAINPALPWGGYKMSGIGRELGWAGIESYTEEKVVTVVT
jgi:acyl-CoA reductase-like NAD-dependent aldehyde dehydrogenase